jgi:hypothetical protein
LDTLSFSAAAMNAAIQWRVFAEATIADFLFVRWHDEHGW